MPFLDYCDRVQEHLERRYSIRVVTRDIPAPLIGDLDGFEIHIDRGVTAEQRFFLLAHLFGHTAQWNLSDAAFEIGKPRQPPVDESLLPAIVEYEREAASYALAMLHEAGITEADQWVSDYTACDMAYLMHYYRTGVKQEFRSFWVDRTPLIEARSAGPFTPRRRVFRSDGVVI